MSTVETPEEEVEILTEQWLNQENEEELVTLEEEVMEETGH